ncbi:hypothetical protein BH09VER1_BH09VER1_51160 [soil metagenome]
MNTWWAALNLPLQLFYAIGVVAGLVLLVEVILTSFGMDHHNIVDTNFDHPDGFGLLSVRTVTGFFFGFGWSGVIAIKSGASLPWAIVIAVGVGLVFFLCIMGLLRALYSLRASGTLDYKNAIGQTGTIYVTTPANFAGPGQIEVLIQGRLQMISCMTRNTSPLPPQTKVKVTALVDQGTLEVEPLS